MTIKEVRAEIFHRDGNKCFKCGDDHHLCLDHILPKPQFQLHNIDNLITLCLDCNFKKGTVIPQNDEITLLRQYLTKVNVKYTQEERNKMNNVLDIYFIKKKRHKEKERETLRSRSLKAYEAFASLHSVR